MLSFITPANPNPALPGTPTPTPPPDTHLTSPHPLHRQPSTQSLFPSTLTTTPNSASTSIHSTDPIDVEKALPTAATTSLTNGASHAPPTNPDILPSLSTLTRSPVFLSTLLERHLGPPDRQIWGLPRNTFASTVLASLYIFLALVLALGIGYMPYRHPPGYNPNSTSPGMNGNNIIFDSKDTTTLPLPKSGSINTGQATYYNPALGSCGTESTDNDPIVAVSRILYDAASVGPNPNANPLCGRKVRATRYRDDIQRNITIEATVVDRCVGCAVNDLDLSPYLFAKLANPDLGRVDVTWAWI